MLNSSTTKLDQLLVRLIAAQSNLTASVLHEQALLIRPCTLQGVYHELRKLQADGVIVKLRDTYSLSLTWAFEFMELADKVYDNYIISASRSEVLPASNSSKTWKFSNLLRLDDFWVQAMVIVFTHTKSKHLYSWIPHPWYFFAQMGKVSQFYALCEKEGWRYHMTIGGTTYLDRQYVQRMPTSFFEYRLGESPVFSDMDKYYSIIGDYIVTVKLDVVTAKRVNELFESITCAEDLKFYEVFELLNTPGNLSIKLEHNPNKVGGYVRKFQRFFGTGIEA